MVGCQTEGFASTQTGHAEPRNRMVTLTVIAVLAHAASPPTLGTLAQEAVHRTNIERVKEGLAPLKTGVPESEAAQWMATDLANANAIRHTDSLGRDFATRVTLFGVARPTGENCAAGQQSPTEVVDAWMISPKHHKNMMNSKAKLIGLGHAYNSKGYGNFWTMVLANADWFPVIIDNEAPVAYSDSVSLYLYGEAFAQKMRISGEDGGWTEWMPFQQVMKWRLSEGNGMKTVRVELADADGRTKSAEDTIERR